MWRSVYTMVLLASEDDRALGNLAVSTAGISLLASQGD